MYRAALLDAPEDDGAWQAEAHHLLGACLQQQGRHAEAVGALERAIQMDGGHAAYHHNLANSLRELGDATKAEAAYRRALAIEPGFVHASTALGNLLKAAGRFDQAITLQADAAEASPQLEGLWRNLRLTYEAAGRLEQGRTHLRQAVARFPAIAVVAETLAALCVAGGWFDEAAEAAGAALAIAPGSVSARLSLASSLKEAHDVAAAIALLREAVALEPDHADAQWNLALALLQTGRYAEGWAGLEWRRRLDGVRPRLVPGVPEWDGGAFPGRTLLLIAEQGLGDALQFVRYASLAKARGGHVVVEAQPALVRLLAGADGVDEVIAAGGPRPRFDLQAPMFSLPALCGPPPTGIAAPVPYLRAEPDLVARWAGRVRRDPARLRVGVVWQGNPRYRADARRSVGLARLAPLSRVPGVRLFSLQKGPGEEQAGGAPAAIDNLSAELDRGADAFVDTAAALAHMDLVIGSDTSLPHLAGALGRPVWLLLSHVPDWRWGLGGNGTPWYPGMRLFRQPRPGDWDSVIVRVTAELHRLLLA